MQVDLTPEEAAFIARAACIPWWKDPEGTEFSAPARIALALKMRRISNDKKDGKTTD